ncbi:MAG: class I SAM-dependent methyltransferase [Pseudomonadota bacterium]
MNPANDENGPLTGPETESHAWFSRLPGQHILASELEVMAELLPDLFGYHLLFVGASPYVTLVESSRIQFASFIDTRIDTGPAPATAVGTALPMVHASADDLPVSGDSIDVVVMPHVIEFQERPHDALREAERVLVPDGHLVLAGFNPFGFMGFWRALKRRREQPWNGQFFSLRRVKDWLALLGFDIVKVQHRFFRPPVGSERLLAKVGALEKIGQRGWPYLGGTYVILARKRLTTVTPIRTRWRPRRLVSVGLAEPAPRSADQVGRVEHD